MDEGHTYMMIYVQIYFDFNRTDVQWDATAQSCTSESSEHKLGHWTVIRCHSYKESYLLVHATNSCRHLYNTIFFLGLELLLFSASLPLSGAWITTIFNLSKPCCPTACWSSHLLSASSFRRLSCSFVVLDLKLALHFSTFCSRTLGSGAVPLFIRARPELYLVRFWGALGRR